MRVAAYTTVTYSTLLVTVPDNYPEDTNDWSEDNWNLLTNQAHAQLNSDSEIHDTVPAVYEVSSL